MIQPAIAGSVKLYFTRPWSARIRTRIKLWIGAIGLGLPIHVTPAVNGTAFNVAPGQNCFQLDERFYEFMARGQESLYDIVTVDVPDLKGAADAAWTYAVGPMTHWQAFKRWRTGHEDGQHFDCVLAAVMVLRGGGLDVPPHRTPKGLYTWLKARTDSAS